MLKHGGPRTDGAVAEVEALGGVTQDLGVEVDEEGADGVLVGLRDRAWSPSTTSYQSALAASALSPDSRCASSTRTASACEAAPASLLALHACSCSHLE